MQKQLQQLSWTPELLTDTRSTNRGGLRKEFTDMWYGPTLQTCLGLHNSYMMAYFYYHYYYYYYYHIVCFIIIVVFAVFVIIFLLL